LAQQATPNTKHAGKRLLIADDDTDMRLLRGGSIFRRWAFQVEERERRHGGTRSHHLGTIRLFIFDVVDAGHVPALTSSKRVRDRGIQNTGAVPDSALTRFPIRSRVSKQAPTITREAVIRANLNNALKHCYDAAEIKTAHRKRTATYRSRRSRDR
jgi:hypothetical protein